jgi:RMI1, N-terminal OB-fold domain
LLFLKFFSVNYNLMAEASSSNAMASSSSDKEDDATTFQQTIYAQMHVRNQDHDRVLSELIARSWSTHSDALRARGFLIELSPTNAREVAASQLPLQAKKLSSTRDGELALDELVVLICNTDLRRICGPSALADSDYMKNESFELGDAVYQLQKFDNVAEPSVHQEPIGANHRRTLRLWLTDGVKQFQAVESDAWPRISMAKILPGAKVRVRKAIGWRGIFTIAADDIAPIGGRVERLAAAWRARQGNARRLQLSPDEQPPPFHPLVLDAPKVANENSGSSKSQESRASAKNRGAKNARGRGRRNESNRESQEGQSRGDQNERKNSRGGRNQRRGRGRGGRSNQKDNVGQSRGDQNERKNSRGGRNQRRGRGRGGGSNQKNQKDNVEQSRGGRGHNKSN